MSKMLMPFTGIITILLSLMAVLFNFGASWYVYPILSSMVLIVGWVGVVRMIEYRRLEKIMRFIYPEDAILSTIRQTLKFSALRVTEMWRTGIAMRVGRYGYGQRRVYAYVVSAVSNCSLKDAYKMWDSHVDTRSIFSVYKPLSLKERFFSPNKFAAFAW